MFAYRKLTAARQARMVAAAAMYPEDNARTVKPNFLSKLTPEERAFVDVGSIAGWPGHGKMLNVPEERGDVTFGSWSGKFPGGIVTPELKSTVAADVFEAKVNPPVNFHDRLAVGTYYTGLPSGFLGGVVDPQHRKCLKENHGIINDHAVYVNPSVKNLTEAKHPSDSSSGDYLEQDLTSKSAAAKVLQAPFTPDRGAKGFVQVPLVKNAVSSTEDQPGRLEKEVKYHLSTCGAIFDIHGSTGSVTDDEVKVGVVTDHAALGLFWRNLLFPTRPKDFFENTDYTAMVQIYHAGGYTVERERVIEEFGGPKLADLGIEHESFIVVDPYSKPATALISGELDLNTCREVAAYLNSLVLFDELDTLTLPGHALYDPKTSSAEVFINGPSELASSPMLYGAHHLTLSPDGLGRVWNGFTAPTQPTDKANFNLITKNKDGSTTTTAVLQKKINDASSVAKPKGFYTDAAKECPSSRAYTALGGASMTLEKKPAAPSADSCLRPNLVPLPKTAIVFTKQGGTGRKEVSADEAGKLLMESLSEWGYVYGDAEAIVKNLEDAMTNGVKCYVQSTGKSQAPPEPATPPKAAPAAPSVVEPAETPTPTPAPEDAKKRAAKKKTKKE
eukprot:TRINITY_DN46620_c0_g1_i1.p1 TRINITY_DN46620_c0_g1~~TRINITY_DN46620_c0_g1_i1.p1  ORF type:complete len:655 (+),score=129.52 TRINITY_DN46620_c0_g1_i1:120-1967(+)